MPYMDIIRHHNIVAIPVQTSIWKSKFYIARRKYGIRSDQEEAFFQYWRNVSDADVLKCLRMLTFLPLEQIDEMDKWEGSKLNEAKEILAFELTKLVHGEEEAQKAQEAARALFSNGGDSANMPTCEVSEEDLRDGAVDILALLVKSGLAGTRSEARRNVTQGGVTLDGEKVTDFKAAYTLDDFKGEGKVLKRGKKKFIKIVAE